jgi:hypothetical protein
VHPLDANRISSQAPVRSLASLGLTKSRTSDIAFEPPDQYTTPPHPLKAATFSIYVVSMSLVHRLGPEVRLLFVPDFGD